MRKSKHWRGRGECGARVPPALIHKTSVMKDSRFNDAIVATSRLWRVLVSQHQTLRPGTPPSPIHYLELVGDLDKSSLLNPPGLATDVLVGFTAYWRSPWRIRKRCIRSWLVGVTWLLTRGRGRGGSRASRPWVLETLTFRNLASHI